ncbi:hypothetical protein Tco_0858254 [Tanacetum coccineum]|uniref:Uncharacterized protein n=1 Tax=Tanacetum coccineum TaxID=301880 RepID=A0ABQ5BBC7_9ASTR
MLSWNMTLKNVTRLCQKKLDWENPEGDDYPFDLTKPLPLVMNGNRQIVLVNHFFNNDLKYLQGGILTMTYTTSTTKIKVAQYDLPGIKDMAPNIWSSVKVPLRIFTKRHGYSKGESKILNWESKVTEEVHHHLAETTRPASGTGSVMAPFNKASELRLKRHLRDYQMDP